MRKLFVLCCFLLLSQTHSNPYSYPQGDFIWPVRHRVGLSGSFGELRATHFHSGVDIRSSNGRKGDPIYAAASGYVSRIKVEASGYGKALYLTHSNGFTTVYGHLDRFTEEIEAYVKAEQYRRRSFALDIYLPDTLFVFRQNEYIGRMGNRGRSSGPHLHFEIRDTETEEVINPLAFGLKWRDLQAPKMYYLKVYELDELKRVLNSVVYKLYREGERYRLLEKQLVVRSPYFAVSVVVDDPQPSGNRNGIVALQLLKGDSLLWGWELSRFSFADSRYVLAHEDYAEWRKSGRRFQRCHRLPGNLLPAYSGSTDGYFALAEGEGTSLEVRATDFSGHTARLNFSIRREAGTLEASDESFNYFLPWEEASLIEQNNVWVYLPEGSLYRDQYFLLHGMEDRSSEYYSDVYLIHKEEEPLHLPMEIGIRPLRPFDESLRDKLFIAYCSVDGRITNCGSRWKEGFLTGRHRSFGTYAIQLDTTPPVLEPLSLAKDMRARNRLSFRAYDDIKTARHLESLHWEAYIDGRWVLFEYDAKTRTLFYVFDEHIQRGAYHHLDLIVRDALGNERVFKWDFRY